MRGNLGGTLQFQTGPAATGQPAVAATQPTPAATPVYDIDTLCRQYALQPHLLLIDVEGSERMLLQTAPNLPASVRHIIMELHPGLFPQGPRDAAAIIEVLAAEGFALQQALHGVFWFARKPAMGG